MGLRSRRLWPQWPDDPMQANPFSRFPRRVVFPRLALVTGAGVMTLALSLSGCGKGEVAATTKRPRFSVVAEAGALPAPGTAKRLEREQSVFLRRHAQDPVDWLPWGSEAFARAKAENKLMLVSIGYSSCPWSQKMQDETFTDPAVARFMNAHYINVLVDREERPDVNNVYLNFLFWKNKQSGWPLHMWITPDGLPVFSGVYFPAKPDGDQPSWTQTVEHVANSWTDDPEYVHQQAVEVMKGYLREYRRLWKNQEGTTLTPEAQASCFEKLRAVFDPVNGGFTPAPKFAQPHALEFLLNYSARLGDDRVGRRKDAVNILTVTIDNLIRGGIFDQLGGGFHRYSTDIYWAMPQFEKMLYDQGFMASALTEAGVALNRPDYLEAVRQTLRYADQELSHPDGGFFSAESSSSPVAGGGTGLTEGEYYLWQYDEIVKVAGTAAMPLLRAVYDVDDQGNIPIDSPTRSRFPKANSLRVVKSLEEAAQSLKLDPAAAARTLAAAKSALLAARKERPHPLLDSKVIASWNGTILSGFARAGWALNDAALLARAEKAGDFILSRLRRDDGTLIHSFLDTASTAPGYSEDYALVIRGLLDLYEATGSAKWLKAAVGLQDKQNELLWDQSEGGFYDGPQQPLVFNRMKSVDESTEFAPCAVSASNLARLGNLLNRPDDLKKGQDLLKTFGGLAQRAPAGFLRFMQAADLLQRPPLQIVITGSPDAPDRAAVLAALRKRPTGGTVRLYLDGGAGSAEGGGDSKQSPGGHPSFAKLTSPAGRTTVHFCRNFEPVHSITDPAQIQPWLEAQALTNP